MGIGFMGARRRVRQFSPVLPLISECQQDLPQLIKRILHEAKVSLRICGATPFIDE